MQSVIEEFLLTFRGKWDGFKLLIAHDDGIPVLAGNLSIELFLLIPFQLFLGRDEDMRIRIEAEELGTELCGQVTWHNHEGLMAKTDALGFHGGSLHLERLARTDDMRKERIAAEQGMRYRVLLVRPEFDFWVHARKVQVRAVVFTRTDVVEVTVVILDEVFLAALFLIDPFEPGFPDGFDALLGKHRLLEVQDGGIFAAYADSLVHLDGPVIECAFR